MEDKTQPANTDLANVSRELKSLSSNSLVDSSLIDYTLSLSFEDRLLQHERARQTIRELQNARKAIYGESSEPPQDAPRK